MMKSLSSIGLGLSVLFGCLLLALVAEVYYLLWWKKRLASTEIEDKHSNPAKELLYTFCWRRSSSLSHTALDPQEMCTSVRVPDNFFNNQDGDFSLQSSNKDSIFLGGPFGEDGTETELMGLQYLAGPPRFLFTIAEETKEDLESEDDKSRADYKSAKGSRSLSDFLLTVETPYLTPLASPPFFTPPLTPMSSITSCSPHRFNPLFESITDAEFNRIRSSPPPKFKFLQDAEDKLRRKLMEEAAGGVDVQCVNLGNGNISRECKHVKEDDDCSLITIIVDKSNEISHRHHLPHCHSSTSQVLPLASSPLSLQQPDYQLTRNHPG